MLPTAHMTADENRIARDMHKRGFIPAHIAGHLGRERSTITRLLAHAGPDPRQGRPEAYIYAPMQIAWPRETTLSCIITKQN